MIAAGEGDGGGLGHHGGSVKLILTKLINPLSLEQFYHKPIEVYIDGPPYITIAIEFYLPVTIAIIPDVLVINVITKLY